MINRTIENKTVVRVPRDLIDLFSHKTVFKPMVSGSGSQIHVIQGDAALAKTIDSPGQAGMKAASKLIEDGGEFIRTPFKWLKDMQANWLIYVVCAAIICLSILYAYCMARKYFACKPNVNTGFTSQLADIALKMANNRGNPNAKSSNSNKQVSCGSTSDPNTINN